MSVARSSSPLAAAKHPAAIAAIVVAGSLALAVSAHIKVPFWPVPMTMQTFVVAVLALTLGARLAGASVLFYLAQGAFGLPVFAGGTGLAVLAGPTAGYLFGFLAAAMLVGHLRDRGYMNGLVATIGGAALAIGIVYVIGVAWLALAFLPLERAAAVGVLPFLLGDAVKAILAGATVVAASRFIVKRSAT